MPLLETKGAASAQSFGGIGAGSSGPVTSVTYIEDVFSTYLYTGNGSTQTVITNGINLSGKGGLVWIKSRSNALNHALFDTARGASKQWLYTNSTSAEVLNSSQLTAFNSDGFSLGNDVLYENVNTSPRTYASWTFRKQPKFFDMVTYTGNDTAGRTIAHSLGSVPGCIIVKCYSADGDNWIVYHRSLGATKFLILNSTGSAITSASPWNDTEPTDTVFSVGGVAGTNGAPRTYVAYLFAHNAGGFGLSGTDNVISCGSFTTDGSGNATVNLGYEPQWVMDKVSSSSGDNWIITDIMRGQSLTNSNFLFPNLSNAESVASYGYNIPTATGFNVINHNSNTTYIYIAIRRGPMKVPTSGTSVFTPTTYTGDSTNPRTISVGFAPDLVINTSRVGTNVSPAHPFFDRLRGDNNSLVPVGTQAENGLFASTVCGFNLAQNSHTVGGVATNNTGTNFVDYSFRRAPGFFDVVCYTGTGSARTVTHNLGVAPQLIIVKSRTSGTSYWPVYSISLGNQGALALNEAGTNKGPSGSFWDSTSPTSTSFSLGAFGQGNAPSENYVAYLFATCPGVSKVGIYTGTGALQTINCGFTGGARFVMIKRTDSTGDWYVWDTARGIVSGNDPYLLLNSSADEVTNTDYIDPVASGFELSSTAPAAINANGGTYIFLAIA